VADLQQRRSGGQRGQRGQRGLLLAAWRALATAVPAAAAPPLPAPGAPIEPVVGADSTAVAKACAQDLPLRVDCRERPPSPSPCTAPWPEVPLSHYVTLQAQALQRLGLQAP
jgi:hypothetical protein